MKKLLLIVIFTLSVLSCKKGTEPEEVKDEWVIADSVEIFDRPYFLVGFPATRPRNYIADLENETLYMVIDSTTGVEYIQQFYNLSDEEVNSKLFSSLEYSGNSTKVYMQIFSFVDWRSTIYGSQTNLVAFANHSKKELKIINKV